MPQYEKGSSGNDRSGKMHEQCRAFERLLAETAREFNNAAQDQFPSLMNQKLGAIASFLKFDRSSILVFAPDRNRLQLAYSWSGKDIPAVKTGSFIEEDLPWYVAHVRSGHLLRVETVSDLPPEAEKERGYLLQEGIKSMLSVPLIADGISIGAVTFGTFRLGRRWPPEIILRFRLVGEILTLALERYRSSCSLVLLSEQVDSSKSESMIYKRSTAHLRHLALYLIEAEYRERKRMAGILHEDIMQTPAAIRFRMQQNISNSEEIEKINELVRSVISDLRNLVMDLQPVSLYSRGIVPALHSLAEQFSQLHNITVELDAGSDEITPSSEEGQMLMCEAARQLLSNAVVHGRATKVDIQLRQIPKKGLQLTVTDNGSGFDKNVLEEIPSKSFGLFALREKVQLFGGSVKINTAPHHGARVTVILPDVGIEESLS